MASSTWRYDPRRDCYVEEATGFTSTLKALLSAKSDASFEVGPAGEGLWNRADWSSCQQQQLGQQQAYAPQPKLASRNTDDILWLRRRIREIQWRP